MEILHQSLISDAWRDEEAFQALSVLVTGKNSAQPAKCRSAKDRLQPAGCTFLSLWLRLPALVATTSCPSLWPLLRVKAIMCGGLLGPHRFDTAVPIQANAFVVRATGLLADVFVKMAGPGPHATTIVPAFLLAGGRGRVAALLPMARTRP